MYLGNNSDKLVDSIITINEALIDFIENHDTTNPNQKKLADILKNYGIYSLIQNTFRELENPQSDITENFSD